MQFSHEEAESYRDGCNSKTHQSDSKVSFFQIFSLRRSVKQIRVQQLEDSKISGVHQLPQEEFKASRCRSRQAAQTSTITAERDRRMGRYFYSGWWHVGACGLASPNHGNRMARRSRRHAPP